MGCICTIEEKKHRFASLSSCSSACGTTRLVMSQSQKVLIRKTWPYLEADMTNIGTQVFLRIFDQNPKVKNLFPFRDEWGDDLITHPIFAAHAYRFMAVVKQAVERLDCMEESFANVLIRLGVRHSANISFSAENFKIFTSAMLYIWQYNLKDVMTPECREAWRSLFEYIMLRLQEGFEAGSGANTPWMLNNKHYQPLHIDIVNGHLCHQGINQNYSKCAL